MGERRKRQHDEEEVEGVQIHSDVEDAPNKKPRKETNASARRSLFVRALPSTATSEDITKLFSESYPLKHATIVLDPETKQSKGYGFVTFADAEDAERAKEEFNGQNFMGRRLKIEVAEPRHREKAGVEGKKTAVSAEAASAKAARAAKREESSAPPKLIIRNLPWSIKQPKDLEVLFQKFGKVKHVNLPKKNGHTQAGFGFVVMRGRKNAEKAMEAINGTMADGRILAVDWAVEKDVYEKAKGEEEGAPKAKKEKKPKADKPEKEESKKTEDPSVDDDVANFMKNFGAELESEPEDSDEDMKDAEDDEEEDEDEDMEDDDDFDGVNRDDDEEAAEAAAERARELERRKANFITDNSSTVFVRNLPFTTLDSNLKEHFEKFGAVRYARVVMDKVENRPKGTGFVCFYNVEDAEKCVREAPRHTGPTGANAIKPDASKVKHSVLEDESKDETGLYTIDGRVMQVTHAVEREKAVKLTEQGILGREGRDRDKRRLYLLSEGTVAAGTALYNALSPSEVKMREDSAKQRKKLIQGNPSLHLSLTRLSVRNLPRNIDSKALKALAREAVVGFAKDVRSGLRQQLSKEEESRGGPEMAEAERLRKAKGKGIVKQAKIVFEGKEGSKVEEKSGAGRSRGYGFIEYQSHRWALMGLRWLNGHALENGAGKKQRLIVEFAIENAQVVERRKQNEEKARQRSKDVLEQREQMIKEGKKPEKKGLSKDQQMKKGRLGQKGKAGKPAGKDRKDGKEWKGRPGAFNKGKPVEKGGGSGRDGPAATNAKGKPAQRIPRVPQANGDKSKFKPGFAEGEEGRLARRAQIIQKKRQMRRERKGK
jgi:nucleolar protein 4